MIACKQTIIILIRIWSLLELVHVWVNTRLLQVFGVGHLPLVESSHAREGLEAGIDGDVIYLAGAGMNHGVSFTGPRMVRLSATMWSLAGLLLAFLIRLAVFRFPDSRTTTQNSSTLSYWFKRTWVLGVLRHVKTAPSARDLNCSWERAYLYSTAALTRPYTGIERRCYFWASQPQAP